MFEESSSIESKFEVCLSLEGYVGFVPVNIPPNLVKSLPNMPGFYELSSC